MPNPKTKESTTQKAPLEKQPQKRLARFKRIPKQEKQVIKTGHKRLPSGYKLLIQTCQQLLKEWKLLGGILLVYAFVDLILVGGNGTGPGLLAAKNNLVNLFHGHLNELAAGFTLFSFLVSSNNNAASGSSGTYQIMLLLVVSIVFIWALRQVYAGHTVRIRDAFYTGTYSLVPSLLVLFVIGIQLLPFVIGASMYSLLASGGILAGPLQHLLAIFLFVLLTAWTLYMVCGSIIALYIVTLPGMTPLKALRSAKQLVRFRRWTVLRKLLFLIVVVAVGGGVSLIPVAIFVTPLATLVFLLLTVLAVGIIHGYIYGLYREML